MADGSLIAPEVSTRKGWTGIGLADSVQGLVESIEAKSWVDGALAGFGTGLEVTSTVLDPFGSLASSGLSWTMEHFEPLREVLDSLTGIPDAVTAHATTWYNMADELATMAEDLKSFVLGDTPDWTGDAAEAYQRVIESNAEAIGGLAGISVAMSQATSAAGNLVLFVREIVRDLIADLVGRVIVWAVEAMFVVTIPVITCQIAAAVVKWAGRIMIYTTSLITSLTNLTRLITA